MKIKIASLFCIFAALLLVTVSCSNAKPVNTPTGKSSSSDDDDDDFGTTLPSDSNARDSFKGCGYDSFNDNETLVNTSLTSDNITETKSEWFGSVTVTVKANIDLDGDLEEIKTTSSFDIVDDGGARSQVQEKIDEVSGTRTASIASSADWKEVLDSSDWKSVYCTVLPVTELVERTGKHSTTVEFDPPLAYMVSPSVSKSRFELEFSKSRTFDNVQATVKSTTNSKISSGTKRTGSVTIKPISASGANADYAYQVDFDFGSSDATEAFGLYRSAKYYVKSGEFVAVSVQTSIPEVPILDYK